MPKGSGNFPNEPSVMLVPTIDDDSCRSAVAAGIDVQRYRHLFCQRIFVNERLCPKTPIFFPICECKNHIVSWRRTAPQSPQSFEERHDSVTIIAGPRPGLYGVIVRHQKEHTRAVRALQSGNNVLYSSCRVG